MSNIQKLSSSALAPYALQRRLVLFAQFSQHRQQTKTARGTHHWWLDSLIAFWVMRLSRCPMNTEISILHQTECNVGPLNLGLQSVIYSAFATLPIIIIHLPDHVLLFWRENCLGSMRLKVKAWVTCQKRDSWQPCCKSMENQSVRHSKETNLAEGQEDLALVKLIRLFACI